MGWEPQRNSRRATGPQGYHKTPGHFVTAHVRFRIVVAL